MTISRISKTLFFSALIFCGFTYQNLSAQATQSLTFLLNGPSAAHLGMNETTTSTPVNGLDVYVNPGLLTEFDQRLANVNYTLWIGETYVSSASFVYPRERDAFSVAVMSNNTGEIETYDQPGEPSGTFNYDYLAISGAYAYNFNYFSLGASASYLNEQTINQSASGYGVNVGAYTDFLNQKIRTGVSMNNLGEMNDLFEQPSELPWHIRGGFSADIVSLNAPGFNSLPLKFIVAADVIHQLDELDDNREVVLSNNSVLTNLTVSLGDVINLSGGYRFDDSARSWSAGLQVNQRDFTFDFAFIPFESGFSNAYSIGASYGF
jgi:hypothetical protein